MLRSIRPFFFGAKFLGTSLYEIKKHDIIVSKSKIALYILVQFINVSLTIITIHVSFYDTYNTKEQIFLITRAIISFISLLVELVITMYWKNKLSSAMTNILMYDISAKYNEKIHYCTLNWGRCIFTVLTTWWILIGCINYNLTSNYSIISGLSYTIFYGGVCMQILQFAGLTLMLYQRFDHLCRLILPEGNQNNPHNNFFNNNESYCNVKLLELLIKTNVNVIGETLGKIKLEDVWMMHFNLTRAAEKFNYVWSFQLLLWLFSLSLNTLSRLYTLVNPQIHEELLMIRDGMCAVGFLMTLMVLIISCHLTSQRVYINRARYFEEYSFFISNTFFFLFLRQTKLLKKFFYRFQQFKKNQVNTRLIDIFLYFFQK